MATQRLVISAGVLALAHRLQESLDSGDALSCNDVCSRLRDALQDHVRGSGSWCYYIDHFGDAESGDVIYSCDSDTMRASYEMSGGVGAQKCIIDFEGADDVVPRTIYETEADEADHIAAAESLTKTETLYTQLPVYERFISKSERDKASTGDFAGKGKSFPILKAGDVKAAASSLGRVGAGNYSADVVKKNIIRIAKAKGFTSELPKAWQAGTDSKESAPPTVGGLKLVERFSLIDDATLELIESTVGTDNEFEVKVIAPGKGSSAFYPAEVLQREAAKFKKGTQVYINHATEAEERERPEGDWHKLAGAFNSDGYWKESGKYGAGVYAKVGFAPDWAPAVKAKAAYSGVSIRANGSALMEAGRPVIRDGVPVLESFSNIESVDVVTRAGAGGIILTEAARAAGQETDMQETADMKQIREALAATQASNAVLIERALKADAITEGAAALAGVALPDSLKQLAIQAALKEALPRTEAGALDTVKFRETVNREAKTIGAAFSAATGGGNVYGMGSAPVEVVDPKVVEAREASRKANDVRVSETWKRLLPGNDKAAEIAAKGRAA